MILNLTALALASVMQPAPIQAAAPAPRLIGCHPHPGKVMACVHPIGTTAPLPAPVAPATVDSDAPPPKAKVIRFCHPDPSKNRGCIRQIN